MGEVGSVEDNQKTCAVGIDLGTTFSLIAVYRDNHAEVIPNRFNERLTPSIVFYDPKNGENAVGKFADAWGVNHISNFVYDIKRLMGRKFDDVYVQELIRRRDLTYRIVRGEDHDAEIELTINETEKIRKKPEEIAAEILKHLVKYASPKLGHPITEAVISVPAHFAHSQRRATKRAAELAGLKVLKLISEPVAAAIYYSTDSFLQLKPKGKILVFDFGGGTLDVSVINVQNEMFSVQGIDGDSFLGGTDFDQNLMKYFFEEVFNELDPFDPNKKIQEDLLRIKKKCITLKKHLSIRQSSSLRLDYVGLNKSSFNLTMTREKFDSVNEDLYSRAMDVVVKCLRDLKLSKDDIEQVVLVGGSCNIPNIQNMLSSYFGIEKIKNDVIPEEAVALGCAIQAALIKTNNKELTSEVSPHNLGILVNEGIMWALIKKNTPLPFKSDVYRTVNMDNNPTCVVTKIYEGERINCSYNNLLGVCKLQELPAGRVADITFNTVFTLNEDGLLEVEVWTTSNGQINKVNITLEEHGLNWENKKRTIAEIAKDVEDDLLFERHLNFRWQTIKYYRSILYDLDKIQDENDRERVKTLCEEFGEYAQNAKPVEYNQSLRNRFSLLKQDVEPIVKDYISLV